MGLPTFGGGKKEKIDLKDTCTLTEKDRETLARCLRVLNYANTLTKFSTNPTSEIFHRVNLYTHFVGL